MADIAECDDKLLNSIVEVKMIHGFYALQEQEVNDHLDQGWKILKICVICFDPSPHLWDHQSVDYYLGRPAGVPKFEEVDHRTPEEIAYEADLIREFGEMAQENKSE